MENKNNDLLEKVAFAFSYISIEEMLVADSSYIARSLYATATEKQSVASMIITEDDKQFVEANITCACVDIVTRLMAYVDAETQFDSEPYTFVFNLPKGRKITIDSLISHELMRAVSAFILSRWYDVLLPDMAARQQQLYEAAVAMVRHDIFMARGKVARPTSYL